MSKLFTILHSMVDFHREGEVVDFEHAKDQAGNPINTDRLEELGAIRPATKDDDGPKVAYGTPSDLAATPIPTIPPPEMTTGAMVQTDADRTPGDATPTPPGTKK